MADNGKTPPGGARNHAGRPLRVDELLIQAFLCGATAEAAADHAHCSTRTVHRRLRDRGFQERLRTAREGMVAATVNRICTYARFAADALYGLLSSANEPVRLGAARTILEMSTRFREIEEFGYRLARLEERAGDAEAPADRLVG
jgi:hypothetical protein